MRTGRRLGVGAILAIALTAALAAPAQAAPTATAVWQMQDPAVMIDSAGSPDNGVTTNITRVPGTSGDGYGFNGTDSVVRVMSSAELNPGTAPIRFSASVKFSARPGPGGTFDVVRKGISSTQGGDYKMEIFGASQGTVGSCLFKDSSKVVGLIRGTKDLADNQWHTIECVKTSTSVQIVVDGVARTSTKQLGSISNGSDLIVGGKTDGTDSYPGHVDEVRVTVG